jgi:nucleotide-binding universal stress UspA family protein
MSRIIVGVDGSEESKAALVWAVRRADASKAEVTAVLAWTYVNHHSPHDPKLLEAEYDVDDALKTLDTILVATLGADAAAKIKRSAVCDSPVQALLDVSDGAALLVLGARGVGGFKALLVGSVSQECLHHATCPVAIVRGDARELPERTRRIVVGVDGSEPARRALGWALDAARGHGAEVEVVIVWAFPYVTGEVLTGVTFDPSTLAAGANEVLDEALEAADTGGLVAPVIRTVVSGPSAAALLEVAADADLLVVGSRGLGGFRQLLLGSVSHQLAHHAECPVVVVPPTDRVHIFDT